MATQRHLENAPITEALIDLRVKLPANVKTGAFLDLGATLHDRYPNTQEGRIVQSGFEVKAGEGPLTFAKDKGIHGYLFSSADGLNVAQFRLDGYTFNRLRPYTSWESVFPEAWSLWQLYSERTSPEFVSRVAVRYINRLELPLPIQDLSRYLTAPPEVPEGLPQTMSGFLTRVVIQEPDTSLAANITQSLEGGEGQYVTIILDIDVYKTEQFEVRDERIERTFKQLRNLKNRIFFSSITEETMGLFER